MSGIAGVRMHAAAEARAEILHGFVNSLSHRGGVQNTARRGNIGLAQVTLEIGTLSGRGAPVLDGEFLVVIDGRIDNRDDLLRTFHADPRLCDGALVTRAYQRWGTDCLQHLIGEFSFALSAPKQGLLFCARDVVGLRPLFYTQPAGGFAFASEYRALLRTGLASSRVNEGVAAEQMTGNTRSVGETIYEEISRLPAGHALRVNDDGVRVWRYWRPEDIEPNSSGNRTKHMDEFHALSLRVMNDRLCSAGPVCSQLSGGLDSTFVTGLAVEVAESKKIAIQTATLSFEGLPCDETDAAREVAARLGTRSDFLPYAQMPRRYFEDSARFYMDIPESPVLAGFDEMKTRIAQGGSTTMLGGEGGDEWLNGGWHWYSVPARRGVRDDFFASLASDIRTFRWDVLGFAMRYGVFPRIPRLRRKVRKWRGLAAPPWIRSEFATQVNLEDRLAVLDSRISSGNYPAMAQWREATSGAASVDREHEERSCARHGFDLNYPLHDRRLIEFLLALPPSALRQGSEYKTLLRRALHEHGLPPKAKKSEFSCVLHDALQRLNVPQLMHSTKIWETGWLDEEFVSRMSQTVLSTPRDDWHSWLVPLWGIVSVIVWYDQVVTGKVTS